MKPAAQDARSEGSNRPRRRHAVFSFICAASYVAVLTRQGHDFRSAASPRAVKTKEEEIE
jgi:hypothetical protein